MRSLICNPEDIAKLAPSVRRSDPTDGEYVIITSDSYVATLQPLADWHSRKGYPTVTKTVAWIAGAYPVYDTQEKIRNFIIDYYQNHGTMFVLLAPAHSVVPARRGRSICGGYTGNIPADLHYSDVQWPWDGKGNRVEGETGSDTVDLYANVYAGRAPVASAANAQALVNKTFGCERNPDSSYLKRTYLPRVSLFTSHTGEAVSDTIANITPSGWTDTKAASPAPSSFQTAVDAGFGICHGAAHGDDYRFCEDQSCLSVILQNNAGGRTVANMMNSRYGWEPRHRSARPGNAAPGSTTSSSSETPLSSASLKPAAKMSMPRCPRRRKSGDSASMTATC